MKTKPFLSQLVALVVVAAIFYASYGATNALASARANVPEIYFAWERAVPFWAWSIVPYWSLNLLYALVFFLCRDGRELARYVTQLLAAQMIARALSSHRQGAAWIMRRRSQAEMDQLVANAGFKKVKERIAGDGIFSVSLAVKI